MNKLFIASTCMLFLNLTPTECSNNCDSYIQNLSHGVRTFVEFRTILNETSNQITLLAPQSLLNKHLPADVTFLIADLKYTPDREIKILEFGQATRSRFLGYDDLYGPGKIWEQFWSYLNQFKIPVWLVNTSIATQAAIEEISYNQYKKYDWFYSRNINDLEHNKIFKKMLQFTIHQPATINQYSGVVVIRSANAASEIVKKLQQKHKDFIILDFATGPHVNNKDSTNSLFADPSLSIFRPKSKLYPKEYSPELVKKICSDFQCENLVIKPLAASKGYGVIITQKKHLDFILKNILNKSDKIKYSRDKTYNYWIVDPQEKFLVEEYIESKSIIVNNKPYDPTMRMVFTLHCEAGTINLTLLDGYWKLPKKSTDDTGSLTEKHKSSINPLNQSSEKINSEDLLDVKTKLKLILPYVYIKMLEKT
jgi:hypothetical protein